MPDRIPLTLSVEDACRLKFQLGSGRYRTLDQPFRGEPLYEGWEDGVDVVNYCDEALRQYPDHIPEITEIRHRSARLARDIRDLALRVRAERGL